MADSIKLWEQPAASEVYMLAGWQQWADAGDISSGLPQYLIEKSGARKIGELNLGSCYLFQLPGTHHFLRPEVKLVNGHREELTRPTNDIYYTESNGKGLVIFVGHEPHMDVDRYSEAFMAVVKRLGVRRVVALGGVYGPLPYTRAREVHAIYSLPHMREELAQYAVKFSDYEGGVTISTYLMDRAEHEGIELASLYGFVPAYDFSNLSEDADGIRIDEDFQAWHELMRRVDAMFGLWFDLSDLERKGAEVRSAMKAQIDELDQKNPKLKIRQQINDLAEAFSETPFLALDDMWAEELGDILDDMDKE